jgi:RNA polymerase sigma factor (sigma-70 family)
MPHLPQVPGWEYASDPAENYTDLDEVYRDNVTRVYRLIYTKVGNRCDAEDLTADVFLAALPRLRLSAHRAEVRAYLAATARTTLAGHWRQRAGAQVTTIELESAAEFLNDASQSSDAPARAGRILDALPERYRRILELRFLEGCSIKDAARSMSISVANAKVLQHRALAKAAGTLPPADPSSV